MVSSLRELLAFGAAVLRGAHADAADALTDGFVLGVAAEGGADFVSCVVTDEILSPGFAANCFADLAAFAVCGFFSLHR